jgi:hypothetical protein
LNHDVDLLQKQYRSFVRTRQAATQSYEGYDDGIRRQRSRIREARQKVAELMARQGHMLETMAVDELTRRRDRLADLQIKARFAMADSYDRAVRAQTPEAKPEAKIQDKTQAQPEAQPEAQPQAKPQAKPQAQPQAQTQAKTQDKTQDKVQR